MDKTKLSKNDPILVITNLPDVGSAEHLGAELINNNLAACINILSPCTSLFSWEGKMEKINEVPMLIKTTMAKYDLLENAICAMHPYELPEIVFVPILGGLHSYLSWISKVTIK